MILDSLNASKESKHDNQDLRRLLRTVCDMNGRLSGKKQDRGFRNVRELSRFLCRVTGLQYAGIVRQQPVNELVLSDCSFH